MNASAPSLLLVEDDPDTARSLQRTLRLAGFPSLRHEATASGALAAVRASPPDILLLDLHLGSESGLDLLPELLQLAPETFLVVITGQDDTATAVACMKAGARDFLVKPVEQQRLLASLHHAVEMVETLRENRLLRESLLGQGEKNAPVWGTLLTRDPAMQRLLAYAAVVAHSPRPVLITGENGTGKELLARALHQAGPRREGPWITVNVAGLDDQTFSDTLFGHHKGAFTGAATAREGLVRRAEDGSLLLDEIGDLRPESQVKLLRLLQEREFFPLGSDVPQRSNARILTSTNHDLEAAVRTGSFRADLFYRLRFHHLHLPPLRERLGDLELLIPHFLNKAAEELELPPTTLSAGSRAMLAAYSFPGNVRELEGLIFDATARYSGQMTPPEFWSARLGRPLGTAPPELPHPIRSPSPPSPAAHTPTTSPTFSSWPRLPTLQEARSLLIQEALHRTQGNRSAAARMLGISPQALHQYLLKKG